MIKFIFISFVKFYTIVFSQFISTSCKFYPSCSNYFTYVFLKHSLIIAFFLTIKRSFYCNLFFKGGFDPSP